VHICILCSQYAFSPQILARLSIEKRIAIWAGKTLATLAWMFIKLAKSCQMPIGESWMSHSHTIAFIASESSQDNGNRPFHQLCRNLESLSCHKSGTLNVILAVILLYMYWVIHIWALPTSLGVVQYFQQDWLAKASCVTAGEYTVTMSQKNNCLLLSFF